jgi:hypothetical protein
MPFSAQPVRDDQPCGSAERNAAVPRPHSAPNSRIEPIAADDAKEFSASCCARTWPRSNAVAPRLDWITTSWSGGRGSDSSR